MDIKKNNISFSTLLQPLFKKCSIGRLRWSKCDLYIKPYLNTFKAYKKFFFENHAS